MLPNTEGAPTAFAKLPVQFPIMLPVVDDFRLPELAVYLRRSVTLGAAVPEAAIHENLQSFIPKRKVLLTRQWKMPSPARDAILL